MSWQQRWMQAGPSTPDLQFAVFTLGSLEYAVDIMRISQIIRPISIRPVPRVPAFIEGVIELRGVVIPIMDLRRRLGIEPAPDVRATKYIIVRLERRLIGLIVDRVVGVHRVSHDAIRPTPDWISGPEASVFSGVCRRVEGLVLLVDLDRLISSDETLDLGALRPPTKVLDHDEDDDFFPDDGPTAVPGGTSYGESGNG
ncbi:MAG: chemotaxis protein CheW [bacterium]